MTLHSDNCFNTTHWLLKSLNVKHTKAFLRDKILSHPDHPSLLCISETLDQYNIENLAVKVDDKKLPELPLPFIVQLSDKGGMFYVVRQLSDNEVKYFGNKGKLFTTDKTNFLKRWTGVCLLAESSERSVEPGIKERLREKQIVASFTFVTIALLVFSLGMALAKSTLVTDSSFYFLGGFVLLKLIGLATGTMLLWYEVDKYNPMLQSFCSGGKKVNCEAVLGSKHSKLLGSGLSLGLLAFAYFFGTFSFLEASGFSAPAVTLASFLSFATLPVVLLSVYYQAMIIKQWCKFCIVVQAVLALEMIVAYFGSLYTMPFAWEPLPLLLGLLLLPIPIWQVLKPCLEAKKDSGIYKKALKKIKNNPDVLTGLLAKTRKIATITEGLGISLNSKGAKYHVIKVCNPYCGPCAKAHPILEGLVSTGKINLQILFTAHADEKDLKTEPVRHFLAIDGQGDKKRTRFALDAWYLAEKKDYVVFAKKYPMNGELEQQDDKIKAMRQWCDAEKITHTPTLFINGHELPREYSIENLAEVLG